jgi:transcriptional regulator NrdR family protein
LKCPRCKTPEYVQRKGKNVATYKSDDYDEHRKRYKFCKKCGKAYSTTEQIDLD